MMRAAGRLAVAAAALVALLGGAPGAAAQSGSELVAQEAIGQIRSPFCPGFMLEVCTSPDAAALRDTIRVLAAEGMTANEITEWAIARYGEEWRAEPKRSGLGLWAWLIPPLALLAGAGVVVVRLRAGREAAPAAEAEDALSEEERSKLAGALREWEETGETDE